VSFLDIYLFLDVAGQLFLNVLGIFLNVTGKLDATVFESFSECNYLLHLPISDNLLRLFITHPMMIHQGAGLSETVVSHLSGMIEVSSMRTQLGIPGTAQSKPTYLMTTVTDQVGKLIAALFFNKASIAADIYTQVQYYEMSATAMQVVWVRVWKWKSFAKVIRSHDFFRVPFSKSGAKSKNVRIKHPNLPVLFVEYGNTLHDQPSSVMMDRAGMHTTQTQWIGSTGFKNLGQTIKSPKPPI
jgi:hypothetical protein